MSLPGRFLAVPALAAAAQRQLARVGDARLGEWTEWTGRAFHLRRRLTAAEARLVGPVVDIRGTEEARARLCAVPGLPAQWFAEAEVAPPAVTP
jgi:hypothetical protein